MAAVTATLQIARRARSSRMSHVVDVAIETVGRAIEPVRCGLSLLEDGSGILNSARRTFNLSGLLRERGVGVVLEDR